MLITDVAVPSHLTEPGAKAFPLIRVTSLEAVRAFYVDTLGCTPTFDLPTYLQVQLTPKGPEGAELCFMVDAEQGGGDRLVLSVPVADADAVEMRLRQADVAIAEPAADRPWGWRSLHVEDPTGVILDFFHPLGESPADATS